MAKKKVINCATCDTRKVTEETLAAFETVSINAALILTNEQSKNLLNKYHVTMNSASVLDVEDDVKVSVLNGSGEIKRTDTVPEGKQLLVVNGSLEIGPGTEKILAQHMGIQVNGLVYYPESMGSHLGMMTVNGSRNAYPDGAIVLKRNALIDKVFALRAKERLYWSAKRMVMVAPDLDAEVLVKKGASFAAKEVIISESKVEPLIDRIDEKAELIIVPEGTAVISDDVTLDDILVKKYGKKLYIIGNLTVEDGTLLEQLEYLVIQGDVTVPEAYKTLLVEKAQSITGQVKLPPKGRFISGNASLRVTKWMLEQETDGLTACDCAEVEIAEDISKDLLVNRLTITDCAFVVCPEELQDAVAMICHDVAGIRSESTEGEKKPEDDVTVVNCAEYVM